MEGEDNAVEKEPWAQRDGHLMVIWHGWGRGRLDDVNTYLNINDTFTAIFAVSVSVSVLVGNRWPLSLEES